MGRCGPPHQLRVLEAHFRYAETTDDPETLCVIRESKFSANRLNMKYILILIFLSTISIVPAEQRYKFISVKNGLRLRGGPSLRSKRIALIPYNAKIEILKKSKESISINKRFGSWLYVNSNYGKGWVFSGYLSENPIYNYKNVYSLKTEILMEYSAAESNDEKCYFGCYPIIIQNIYPHKKLILKDINGSYFQFYVGNKYSILDIYDMMHGFEKAIIIDNISMAQINLEKINTFRKKYYQYAEKCVFVSEYNYNLIFHDSEVTIDREPFSKSLPKERITDAQCHGEMGQDLNRFNIPRYYIYHPDTEKIKVIHLKNKCSQLFKNGKIICN